jgi:hypothetical protein
LLGLGQGGHLGGASRCRCIDALQPYQFAAAAQHHLAELLQPPFQLTKHLLGVVVGTLLHLGRLLAGAGDQALALLLGLLAELKGIPVEALRLGLAITLDAGAFLANRLELLQCLLATPLVLLEQLVVAFGGLVLQVLAPGLGLLLQLLAPGGELLLQLGHAGLEFLFGLGPLLAGTEDQLLTLLTGLFPELGALAFRFLADRSGGNQVFPLPPGLGEEFIGLLAGLLDEALPLTQEVLGVGDLAGEGGPEGVHHLDGLLLIDQATPAEGDATAF